MVVSELYYPEDVSTGYFVTRIAEGLTDEFRVEVLCGQPTYACRGTVAPRREIRRDVLIRRLWSTRFDKDKILGRFVNLLTYSLSVLFTCLFSCREGDRLLVLTNPPTVPILVGIAAHIRGGHPALLVHDVYPDVMIATGILTPSGMASRILGAIASKTYRLYERIIVLGRDMADVVGRRMGATRDRVVIITNWGDVDEIRPLDPAENDFAIEHNPKGKVTAQYSGNIGRTHDVETILAAARELEGIDNLAFQFVGGGGKAGLLAEASRNVVHLPRQPRERLNGMLSSADVVVIPFVSEMFGISVPSRMYNVMAAGTPIIAMADKHSELALVVAEEACGWVLPPGDRNGLIDLLQGLTKPEGLAEARRRGLAGRSAAERRFSLEIVLNQFRRLLWDLAD